MATRLPDLQWNRPCRASQQTFRLPRAERACSNLNYRDHDAESRREAAAPTPAAPAPTAHFLMRHR